MNRKLNSRKAGFTLVELMIVVAIIALLATIAVPNFLRSRKRTQATAILEEMRLIDGAKNTWAIENNKKQNDSVQWSDLVPYFKSGSRLATSGGNDLLGNQIAINNIDTPPRISSETLAEFTSVVGSAASFWGSYQ